MLRRGHFALASGKHSDAYWDKFRILERPELLETVCAPIVRRFSDTRANVIVGPTLGGVIVAYEIARQLHKIAAFAERSVGDPGRIFRKPSQVKPNERVLIVDDVYMTGWTLKQMIASIRDSGAVVEAIAVILTRSPDVPAFDCEFFFVHRLVLNEFEETKCPLCADRVPLVAAAGVT